MCTVKNEFFYLYTVLSASLSTPVLNRPTLDCRSFFWYAWMAQHRVGFYTLKSRRAAGFPNGVPSFYISGANSNRSSHLSRIVPTTADLSSAFNLQCLSNMFFFFFFPVYLNIPSRSASFTVKCCGLVFFIHLTWIWHKFLPIFKNFSMTFL